MEFDQTKYHLGKLCKRGHEYKNTGMTLRNKYNQCLDCGALKSREYYWDDPITGREYSNNWNKRLYKENPNSIRNRIIKNKYGITLEQYQEMFEAQNGLCAICGQPEKGGKRLCIDHNHETGAVRQLLCRSCNARLGVIEDKNFVSLVKEYLGKFK